MSCKLIWHKASDLNDDLLNVPCVLPVVEVTLKFTYVEKYPDEPPLWEINAQENLEDPDAEDVLKLLQQQVCLSVCLSVSVSLSLSLSLCVLVNLFLSPIVNDLSA